MGQLTIGETKDLIEDLKSDGLAFLFSELNLRGEKRDEELLVTFERATLSPQLEASQISTICRMMCLVP
jgi:hypothetical protein